MKFNKNKLYSNVIKTLGLSLIASSLFATTITPVSNWNKYPIPQEVASTSRGGLTTDKVAIQDGIGAILLYGTSGGQTETNNKPYNQLLLNNSRLLDTTNPTLNNLMNNNVITIPNTTLNEVNNNIFVGGTVSYVNTNGTTCDDGNGATIGETWLNDVCQGGILVNNTCQGGFSGDPYVGDIICFNNTLTHLNNFSNLKSVNGSLDFDSGTITNIDGLINLKSVNGSLYLNRNNITNLNGLSNLTSVNGNLYLYYGTYNGNSNANLSDISGLKSITNVISVILQNNPSQYTKKIPKTAWLCQPAQASKFNPSYLKQVDACETN